MENLDFQYIAKLVTRAQMGDSDAFAELYAATYQKQYRFAYRYLKDEYLAQDALQEVYILVLKGIMTLKDAKLFISWLNQICFRVCFHMHQKQSRYSEEMTRLGEKLIAQSESAEKPPEEQVVTIDQNQYIIRQVMDLPFSESQAILLRYYNNLKIDEVAKLMGISRSSVKRYISSGLNRLKKLIEA